MDHSTEEIEADSDTGSAVPLEINTDFEKGITRAAFAQVTRKSPPSAYIALKLTAEWLVSLMLLILSAPLILVLAVIIKVTSSGSVFYLQTRLGLNGKPFKILKLRTMQHGAEKHSGAVWAAKGDHRVTSIGRVLRASHLDELPQLWNVLRGEMSLIGPRPERPEISGMISAMIPNFPQRLAVRPGITGLAQLLLPADDPDDEGFHCVRRKLEHDLVYISRLSPLLDLRIAIGTPCYFFAVAVSALPAIVLSPYAKLVQASAKHDILLETENCEQAA